MKTFTAIALLFIGFIGNAQTKRENLLSDKVGTINIKYIKSTDLDKNDIYYFVYLSFQNEKYTTITDTKSLGFKDKESLSEFVKDLNTAKTQMDLNQKVNLSWNRNNYNLKLYDFTNVLYITQSDGVKGYCTINNNLVEKLIQLLSKIDFGKDELLH